MWVTVPSIVPGRLGGTVPDTVFGLPTPAIVVHATVVLLPLASLVVLLHAFWPAARRRLGIVTPVLAGVALVLVPLSTESGESLEHSVGRSGLIRRHAELADGMLPWALALFVVAAGLWLLGRRGRGGSGPRWLSAAAGIFAVVVAAGALQQVVRVGHAGAEATWNDVVQTADAGDG
jgi:hypothetical protein